MPEDNFHKRPGPRGLSQPAPAPANSRRAGTEPNPWSWSQFRLDFICWLLGHDRTETRIGWDCKRCDRGGIGGCKRGDERRPPFRKLGRRTFLDLPPLGGRLVPPDVWLPLGLRRELERELTERYAGSMLSEDLQEAARADYRRALVERGYSPREAVEAARGLRLVRQTSRERPVAHDV